MAFPIKPPVEPMLAKLEPEIPAGDGWRYEPKWDGFRAIAFKDGDAIRIDSRNKLRLDRYFPEVVDALRGALPARCVVDGEIVIPTDHGLDFEILQLRLHPAESRVRKLAAETPASFVAFDLLALDDDLRNAPLRERRTLLRGAVTPGERALVTPQTADPATAREWFERFEGAGLDGLIAKRDDLLYVPGKRVMIKIKHERTADVVVGGYRMSKDGTTLGSLILGVYDKPGGTLHNIGFASSFTATKRKEFLETVKPHEGPGAFDGEWGPGGASRWSGGEEKEWISLRPALVCEVAFDHLQGGHRFRHVARFLRWRPDKPPGECTYDQFTMPEPFSLAGIRALAESPGAI